MEPIDPSLEKRVWGRVAGSPMPTEDLRPLIQEAMILAETYRAMARGAAGSRLALLRSLLRTEQEAIVSLRGLQRLQTGRCPALKPLPPETGRNIPEKCWHRTRRAAENYAARMAQPQWGVIFTDLCRREQENLLRLSRLLGKDGRF